MSKTLTFLCVGENGTIDIKLNKIGNPNPINLNYDDNSGAGWKNYQFDGKNGQTITLQYGGSVSFSGNNETFSIDRDNYYSFITQSSEDSDVKLIISNYTNNDKSNILALTNQDEVKHNYQFYSLFKDCKDLADASNLELESDELMCYCYAYMFTNCTSLTAIPQLPAQKLAKSCYLSMFEGCTAISATPLLPAKKLATQCYEQMFEGCTELISAVLPATDLASGCYRQMFYGCENLTEVTVKFVNWPGYHATTNWLTNISPLGRFTKPTVLTPSRNTPDKSINDKIPVGWQIQNNDEDVDLPLDSTIITITQTYLAGEGITINNQTISLDPDWLNTLSSLSWNWIVDYISENTNAIHNHRYVCQNENGLTITLPNGQAENRVSVYIQKLAYGKLIRIKQPINSKIYIGGSVIENNNELDIEAPFCYIEFHYKNYGEDIGWHVINMSTPSSHRDYKAGEGLLSSGGNTITFSVDPNIIPNNTNQLTNGAGFITKERFIQLLDYEEFRNIVKSKLGI